MAYKNKADKTKYQNTYIKETYDRANVLLPKGKDNEPGLKDIVKVAADKAGESVNAYIIKAIYQRLERDGIGQENTSGGGFRFSSGDTSSLL